MTRQVPVCPLLFVVVLDVTCLSARADESLMRTSRPDKELGTPSATIRRGLSRSRDRLGQWARHLLMAIN